jgi:hypothetical protein
MAVNTLIRPKVEYSSAVWDPYTKENVDWVHCTTVLGKNEYLK